MKRLLLFFIVRLTSSLVHADCTATPNAWCQTYPGNVALPANPPYPRAWNHLVWDPDTHKAMILITDAGNIITFSNALYGYTPQYPNVASTIGGAWTKYSSCGTTHSPPPGDIQATAYVGTAIGPSDMTITSRSDFPLTNWKPSGFLSVGDEEMAYSSWTGLTFNISARGIRGTTAASHPVCVNAAGSPTCPLYASRVAPACFAPQDGAGNPINDHPADRHPDNTSTYGHGFLWQQGGYEEVGTPADTWHWDPTNNWAFVPAAQSFNAHDSAIVYHADKDVLIRYGGDQLPSQTAIFCFAVNSGLGCSVANQWLALTSANLDSTPGHVAPLRMKHRLIYDSINRQILMVGGSPATNTSDNQLWSLIYNSGISKWQWTRKADMPYAEWYCPVAFDSHIGKVVLFTAAVSNINGEGTSQGETWLYDPVADSWTQTGVTGPIINTFAVQMSTVFNPDNNTLIMIKQDGPYTIQMYELADSALGTPH